MRSMNEEQIKHLCKETFVENIMNNLDSTLIFKYIQTLEQENKQLKILIENLRLGVTLNLEQEKLLDNILFGRKDHD